MHRQRSKEERPERSYMSTITTLQTYVQHCQIGHDHDYQKSGAKRVVFA